jgi:hypothetical protein
MIVEICRTVGYPQSDDPVCAGSDRMGGIRFRPTFTCRGGTASQNRTCVSDDPFFIATEQQP